MTAISAPRNTFVPTAASATAELALRRAHIRIPGSDRTYEVRDVLRGMGLRWDPVSHAWHGTVPLDQGSRLTRELGLRPQIVPTIEAFCAPQVPVPVRVAPRPPARPPTPPHPHDGRSTRVEARLSYRNEDEDPDEIAITGRRFTPRETMSGLPDDSREADERAAAKQLRELRWQIKAARTLVGTTPGLAVTLRADWQRAAHFYARFGLTEGQFREGVPPDSEEVAESLSAVSPRPSFHP